MSDEQQTGGRRIDRAGTTARGRRGIIPRHRVDAVVVLGILLPSVVVLALALTRGDEPATLPPAPPSAAVLTDASVVCPAAPSRTAGDVEVSRLPRLDSGEVSVRVAEPNRARLAEQAPVPAAPGQLTPIGADGDVVVTGTDAAAPGLVAGRTGEARSAAECRAPSYDEWFIGLGAGARQSSTIELVNPAGGPAVVEVALHGRRGLIEEEDLHGIRVPGHQVVRLDLSSVAPRRGTMAAHVTVVRGRVVTTVRHTYDPLGRARPQVDFLPAQPEPAPENLVLGVPEDGAGSLYLANPGEDEARATVRVVTEDAIFTPAGLNAVVVPPGTVREVALSEVLTEEVAAGALGLQVESGQPLVASVRLTGDDLGLLGPVLSVEDDEPATSVVPAGPKRLVLGGAIRAGVVRVTAADADGELLLDAERVEVGPDRAATLDLPGKAVLVTVESKNTSIAGTFELTGGRSGGLRLRAAEVYAQVPAVRPD